MISLVGDSRFRVPVEPVFVILAGAGVLTMRRAGCEENGLGFDCN
jgi:hypothetical protein